MTMKGISWTPHRWRSFWEQRHGLAPLTEHWHREASWPWNTLIHRVVRTDLMWTHLLSRFFKSTRGEGGVTCCQHRHWATWRTRPGTCVVAVSVLLLRYHTPWIPVAISDHQEIRQLTPKTWETYNLSRARLVGSLILILIFLILL